MTSEQWESLPQPDGWGAWSTTDHRLAAVSDQVAWLTYAVVATAGGKPNEPKPVARPGVGRPPREAQRELADRQGQTAAIAAYIATHQGASPPDGWVPGDPDGE